MKRVELEMLVGEMGTLLISGVPITGVLQKDEIGRLYVDQPSGPNPADGSPIPRRSAYFDVDACTMFSVVVRQPTSSLIR